MGTWWIDGPGLLGSPNPSDLELESLRASGFSVIVCLLDLDEQMPLYDRSRAIAQGWDWHNIPVRDFTAPSVSQLQRFVGLATSCLPGKKVVVHCQGGSGRTGTVAAAYWIAKGLPASGAIETIRQRRPHAIETPAQEAVLREFANTLHSTDASSP